MLRKTKITLFSFLAWTVVFIIIAATPLGFPYRAETNVQRFNILVRLYFIPITKVNVYIEILTILEHPTHILQL